MVATGNWGYFTLEIFRGMWNGALNWDVLLVDFFECPRICRLWKRPLGEMFSPLTSYELWHPITKNQKRLKDDIFYTQLDREDKASSVIHSTQDCTQIIWS